jgi:hypothetical protein
MTPHLECKHAPRSPRLEDNTVTFRSGGFLSSGVHLSIAQNLYDYLEGTPYLNFQILSDGKQAKLVF